jgi:hypothetical protein
LNPRGAKTAPLGSAEVRLKPRLADRVQQPTHFGHAQHGGELLLLGDAKAFEDFPVEAAGLAVEEPESADGDFERSRSGSFFVPEPEQVILELLLAELVRIGPGVIVAQLPHGPQIGFLSPLGHSGHDQV